MDRDFRGLQRDGGVQSMDQGKRLDGGTIATRGNNQSWIGLKLSETTGVPVKPGAVAPSMVIWAVMAGRDEERLIVPIVAKSTVLPLLAFAD